MKLSSFKISFSESDSWFLKSVYFVALSAVLLRLYFWFYTGRTWEDALITVTHSENFARGLGLTHVRVGQGLIHGFTSPISVLIPLLGDIFSVGLGINLLKLVSAFAGGLSVIFTAAISTHKKLKLPKVLALACAAFVAIEHNQMLWGMSGMETQVVTLILLASFYYLFEERIFPLGIILGLCLLARPDFAPWVALAICTYALWNLCRPGLIKDLARILGLVAIVYLPWILFTTLYYGSPVPNTIIAKSVGYVIWWRSEGLGFDAVYKNVTHILFDLLLGTLVPSIGGHGTGFFKNFGWCELAVRIIAVIFAIGLVRSLFKKTTLPLAGFIIGYGIYFMFLVPVVFGWYVIPYAAIAVIITAIGLKTILNTLSRKVLFNNSVFGILSAFFIGSFIWASPQNIWTEKQIQTVIEDRVRKPIGIELSKVMLPTQTVASESLGYVGYYSGRSVYDWPGLCNKQVPEWAKTVPLQRRSLYGVSEHFKPDYLVLREHEVSWFKAQSPQDGNWFDQYEIYKSYDADKDAIAKIPFINANIDTRFVIIRKKTLHS